MLKDISIVKKINDKWVVECDVCGWTGRFNTKIEAREQFLRHLDEHRAPRRGLEEVKGEGGVSSHPEKWPEPRNPGGEPPV